MSKKRCPLCFEDLRENEEEWYPCKCGYQLCAQCLHNIKETVELYKNQCPSCRSFYKENCEKFIGPKYAPYDPKKYIPDLFFVSDNILQITNIPEEYFDVTSLKRVSCLGQYGKIKNIIVESNDYAMYRHTVDNNVKVCYVEFEKSSDARNCYMMLGGYRGISVHFAVNTQCFFYKNGNECSLHTCFKIHGDIKGKKMFPRKYLKAPAGEFRALLSPRINRDVDNSQNKSYPGGVIRVFPPLPIYNAAKYNNILNIKNDGGYEEGGMSILNQFDLT